MEHNQTEHTDVRLFDRLRSLQQIDQDWQGAERRNQVAHEIACIVFEQTQRYASTHPDVSDEAMANFE